MSNEAFRAGMRERRDAPLPLVKTALEINGVKVFVRALPFRQSMQIRRDHQDDDQDTAEARIIVQCLCDSEGNLLLDPLNDEDLDLIIGQKHSDFWLGVTNALAESGAPGKASAQTTNS